MATKTIIKAYGNNDDATIVWKYPRKIGGCWGFAIYRKKKGESDLEAEPVQSGVGFDGDPHVNREMRATTEWPIQKFTWIDYLVRTGDEVCYKVIPMVMKSGALTKDMDNATQWSNWVKLGDSGNVGAYFNRGLVSSQFLVNRLDGIPLKERSKALDRNLEDVHSKIRNFLGGNLLFALYGLLNDVASNKSLQLYGALYELNEEELIKKFNKIGKRAHIILANGAFGQEESDPQLENANKLNKVDLTRRIVSAPHFAHNKFLVITEIKNGKEVPIKVLTGSTNWTRNGLFTQINNAIIISDTSVAAYYWNEWKTLHADCINGHGAYSKELYEAHEVVQESKDKSIQTFFTPVKNKMDLNAADSYIRGAKKGILFLMFKPGVEGKSRLLYDTVREMAKNRDLLINGVINSDPGGDKNPTITFMHKNNPEPGELDIVLPSSINETFESWMQEVGKKNVTIHSKVIVIDPFSDNPVLITGSHNMGSKASGSNDDNLNIIVGNKGLCQAYAVHMMAVYHHYRWRFYRTKKTGEAKWSGNLKSDGWQDWYQKGDKAKEIAFWLEEVPPLRKMR